MTKHTPGPWSYGEGKVLANVNGTWRTIAAPSLAYFDSDTYHANARLIAAAPELLEACQIALECFGDEEGETAAGALADIRDAIAKARGE